MSRKLTYYDKANNWLKNSLSIRLITIGILILLLLIPVTTVQNLIRERENRQREAIEEVSSKWSNVQTITGLILTVPYTTHTRVYDADNSDNYELINTTKYAHFLPDSLVIVGDIFPEMRYRGIYEVIIYKSDLNISGTLSMPEFDEWKIEDENVLWGDAFVALGLTDLRGIQENVSLQWDGTQYDLNPGVESNDVISSGISSRIPIQKGLSNPGKLDYSLNIKLNGSSSLNFIPIGKSTSVTLNSTWKNPSFGGAFLPDKREMDNDGFSANWNISHLNRPYPQSFRGETNGVVESAFGVELFVPVDEYQKSMRSAKYAALFITLTFLVFFFIQIMNRIKIHPIQYFIVGLALCVFYVLLIAISEHLPFKISYFLASVSIIAMITLYAKSISKDNTITKLIGLILVILYLFIFSIIQMQDYALLVGSIGLFIVLGIIMYLSRKIDWYAVQPNTKS